MKNLRFSIFLAIGIKSNPNVSVRDAQIERHPQIHYDREIPEIRPWPNKNKTYIINRISYQKIKSQFLNKDTKINRSQNPRKSSNLQMNIPFLLTNRQKSLQYPQHIYTHNQHNAQHTQDRTNSSRRL